MEPEIIQIPRVSAPSDEVFRQQYLRKGIYQGFVAKNTILNVTSVRVKQSIVPHLDFRVGQFGVKPQTI